jgi:hypothetical protein
MQELVRLKEEEKSQLEVATEKMRELVGLSVDGH